MADQWVAGFANAVSFGITTEIRSNFYGAVATQNHYGYMWNMGQLGGISFTLLMGNAVPEAVHFQMSRAEWLAVIYEGATWWNSAWTTGTNIREDDLQWTDTFNLLPFVSIAAASVSVESFFGALREVNNDISEWGLNKVKSYLEYQYFSRQSLGWINETGAIFFGRRGDPIRVLPTHTPIVIGGREYTGHALDQMQTRGLLPSVVENTIQSGTQIPGKNPGTTVYYDSVNDVSVIINTTSGRVVTASTGRIRQ